MLRSRRVAAMLALAATASVLLPAGAAYADQQPIDLNILTSCNPTDGKWHVDWVVHNQAPVTIVFERAEDPTTGAQVALPGFALGPDVVMFVDGPVVAGDRTSTGLKIWVRRLDRSAAVVFGGVFALPGTCTRQTSTECVTRAEARYKHTFNGAAGVATVELVGKPLCPNEYAFVSLSAYGERSPNVFPDWLYTYDEAGAALSAQATKASFRVNLPPCRAQVRLELWDPFEIAGSPFGRSTGPLADYVGSGPACRSVPSVSSTVTCDGAVDVHLANGPTANTPVQFLFTGYVNYSGITFRRLVLEPGESATVPYKLEIPGAHLDIHVNGERIKSIMFPRGCRPHTPPPLPPIPRRSRG
jgi:hypothetical protein